MTKPLELTDFILSLMAALANAVEESSNEGIRPLSRSYWERLEHFLQSEVTLEKIDLEMKGEGAAAKLGFKLKTDPEFKTLIQKHLEGHLTRLVQDAREFVDELVRAIRRQNGNVEQKVVLLVDSLEQLRGVGEETEKIYASVVELFSGQAGNLAFPKLHVVYTVPPYLSVLAPNLGRNLGGHPITQWPNIHVRTKQGVSDPQGLQLMTTILTKRYEDWASFVPVTSLHQLAEASGGDLRDYFRLLREAVIGLRTKRVKQPEATLDDAIIQRVIQQLRIDLLPLAEDDACWLARIHASKQASLNTERSLSGLARFLDSNLIMNYLNGEPWYDIHPLLIEDIAQYLPAYPESPAP